MNLDKESKTAGEDMLRGGGEMGERMRSLDWSQTPLGPITSWPQSLRSAVSILLPSKAQIVLFWGPELVALYNDAYRPVFGAKHPGALGMPARLCWSEIWDVLGPLLTGVMKTGEAFWAKDHPFYLDRHGYLEETYFDVSYDPVRGETGAVDGVFCIVSETTGRVIGGRRLESLTRLGSRLAGAEKTETICRAAAAILSSENSADLPCALLYLLDGQKTVRLSSHYGAEPREKARAIDLSDGRDERAGPFQRVAESGLPAACPASLFLSSPPPAVSERMLILPLLSGNSAVGFLAAGISRFLALEGGYRDYLGLVGGQISTAIAAGRALDEERRRAETLAELDRAKTAFFGNVSHEFRTPLTLMLGPLEELLAKPSAPLAEADRNQVAVVHRNSLRLLKLVNTLLDFSRIEAGRIQAVYEPTDLAAFTAELASTFRSAIEGAGLRLIIDCPPLPEPVYVDREMWEKVVLNLLSNALKFTFEGEIEAALRTSGGRAELKIRDTGIGIPEEELPRLFERFHRVEGARGRTHEGSGIGLALVQELAKLHGGSVEVESRPGGGSTFTISIPAGKSHLQPGRIKEGRSSAPASLGAGAFIEEALGWLPDPFPARTCGAPAREGPVPLPALPPGPGRRPRILLADDNRDMRDYVRRLLGARYEVEAVGDGQAALEAARAARPDLILSDVMMPKMDGFELARALRKDPGTATIPIILLSARAGEEAEVEGLEAGVDDYLIKPFSARELTARVAAHLELARFRREAAELLLRQAAELEQINRVKDEFLATLSHELRTPLNAILGWAVLLRTNDYNDETRSNALETIERNARAQAKLVGDILDVSRIITGNIRLEISKVDFIPIIQAAVDSMRPASEAKEIALSVKLDSAAGRLLGDPDRLQQIIWNLLSNAIKFTPRGGRVEVNLERRDADSILRISDTGEGINADFLPFVFDRFRQADSSISRSHEGLGLGLSIVRHLAELHGGRVLAESPGIGKGATFTVIFPSKPPVLPCDDGAPPSMEADRSRRINPVIPL